MLATLLTGAVMAISFSAPPGPVAVETIRRGLRGGFLPALRVQLGSILGDVAWCALALVGLAPLAQVPWARAVLAVAGVAVLVALGALGLRESLSAQPSISATTPGAQPTAGAFRTGLAISLANPMAVGYWLSIGGALVAAGVAGGSTPQTGAFLGGFALGTCAWAFIMASLVRGGQVLLRPRVFRWVNVACSLALLGFGLSLAARSLGLPA